MKSSSSPLSYYFRLQYRRGIRALNDNGIYPWLAIPLVILLFVLLTYKLLSNFAFGEYIYAIMGLSISSSLVESRRIDFIKSISTPKDFRIIRLAEQLVLLTPIILGLFIFGWIYIAIGVLFLAGIISFLDAHIGPPFTLPTPFGMRPFEFSRGFRNAFVAILACYILVPIGLSVDNFNLGLASIAGIGLVSGNYFIQPEPRFYVWIHAMSSRKFLLEKTKTIFLYTFVSVIPLAITLFIYNSDHVGLIALLVVSAIAFTEMCMLSKYLAYPSDINVVAGFAMGFSILFPPLMLIIIPLFYFKAIKRLDQVLR